MITRFIYAAAAAGLVLLAVAGAVRMLDAAPLAAATTLQSDGPCEVVVDKLAQPSEVAFGSSVGIVLTFRRTCVEETPAVHLVLAIDGSLDKDDLGAARDGASARVRNMGLDDRPKSQVAVVEFSRSARRVCDFSNSETDVIACLDRIREGDDNRMDLGIREAANRLRGERNEVEEWRALGETIHMYTSAEPDEHCDAAVREALNASKAGIFTEIYCTGNNCNRECIRSIEGAVESGGAQRASTKPSLLLPAMLHSLTVTDTVAPNMRLVPDSVPPPGKIVGDMVVWEYATPIASGRLLTMTLELEPLEMGEWPTNADAVALWHDERARQDTVAFPVPTVVVGPGPGFATATATVAATDTARPDTATPTSTASTTPTATATVVDQPVSLHLPIAWR